MNAPDPLSEQWRTKRQIAEHYGFSVRTVERWIYAGSCPSRLIGSVRRLRLSDVERFLAEQEAAHAA